MYSKLWTRDSVYIKTDPPTTAVSLLRVSIASSKGLHRRRSHWIGEPQSHESCLGTRDTKSTPQWASLRAWFPCRAGCMMPYPGNCRWWPRCRTPLCMGLFEGSHWLSYATTRMRPKAAVISEKLVCSYAAVPGHCFSCNLACNVCAHWPVSVICLLKIPSVGKTRCF